MRRLARLLPLLVAALLGGCMYSFVGGGLPSHIRTVAITTLENDTPQPLLEADVQRALQGELPRSLGVRLAEEQLAHAVVRGRITGYQELAASVRPSQGQSTPGGVDQVPVVQREVRITYDLEIYDQEQDKVIWTARSQSVTGTFLPEDGRRRSKGAPARSTSS